MAVRLAMAIALRVVADVDAGADPHLDPAFDLERDQRLAHGRPAHAQLPRQVALGREPAAGRELAARDQPTQLLGDLPVEALGFDGLEGHRWAGDRELGGNADWPSGQANYYPSAIAAQHPAKPGGCSPGPWFPNP